MWSYMLETSETISNTTVRSKNSTSSHEEHKRPKISGFDKIIHIILLGEGFGKRCEHDGLSRIYGTWVRLVNLLIRAHVRGEEL